MDDYVLQYTGDRINEAIRLACNSVQKDKLVTISQEDYDALDNPDDSTLYIII